jgi:hypothetical protein
MTRLRLIPLAIWKRVARWVSNTWMRANNPHTLEVKIYTDEKHSDLLVVQKGRLGRTNCISIPLAHCVGFIEMVQNAECQAHNRVIVRKHALWLEWDGDKVNNPHPAHKVLQ